MKSRLISLVPARRLAALSLFALANAVYLPGAAAAPAVSPGGLYVGYYQEDALTNPEDPTPGAFVLKLPEEDAAFGGAMYFTFVGCQSSNVGAVKGVKAGAALRGTWSGTVDNSAQSGAYAGTYDKGSGAYKGTYSVSAGKQLKNIEGCVQYYIAPKGTWEMYAVEQNQPASFKLDLAGGQVSWRAVPNTAMTLVYVIDTAVALAGSGNPIKVQTILPGPVTKFDLGGAKLAKGKEYIVVALANTAKAQRAAFASKRFVAP